MRPPFFTTRPFLYYYSSYSVKCYGQIVEKKNARKLLTNKTTTLLRRHGGFYMSGLLSFYANPFIVFFIRAATDGAA